jgi:hypothetical protein
MPSVCIKNAALNMRVEPVMGTTRLQLSGIGGDRTRHRRIKPVMRQRLVSHMSMEL